MLVQVQVKVSHLAIDLDGKAMRFRKGDVFECASDRAKKLGNSVETLKDVLPAVPNQEPTSPDEPRKYKRKTAV